MMADKPEVNNTLNWPRAAVQGVRIISAAAMALGVIWLLSKTVPVNSADTELFKFAFGGVERLLIFILGGGTGAGAYHLAKRPKGK